LGVILVLLIKSKALRVLIIGFLFGMIVPFYALMVTGNQSFAEPGRSFSRSFAKQMPTQFPMSIDGTELDDVSKKFLAEHPTTSQATPFLVWLVFFAVNGILYAGVFWFIYFLVRMLRPKAT
ncbi:MAG: hypothetical protein AAB589_02780, partial [Patescibacteria group bacterium]